MLSRLRQWHASTRPDRHELAAYAMIARTLEALNEPKKAARLRAWARFRVRWPCLSFWLWWYETARELVARGFR